MDKLIGVPSFISIVLRPTLIDADAEEELLRFRNVYHSLVSSTPLVSIVGRSVARWAQFLDVLHGPHDVVAARRRERHRTAVVLLGGDKTVLGSNWYPANLAEAESRLQQYCQQHPTLTPIIKRGAR